MKLGDHPKIYWNNVLVKEKRLGRSILKWIEMKKLLKAKNYPRNHEKKLHE